MSEQPKDELESPPDFHHVTVRVQKFQATKIARNANKNIKTIMHVKINSLEDAKRLRRILDKQIKAYQDGMGFPMFDIIGEFTRVE